MNTTAVEKGLQFEKAVVDMLNKCGFSAFINLMPLTFHASKKNIKRLSRLSEKPLRIVFEFGLLDFLIAYAIREMYNYTVLVLDTQM